jgi:hypothetical protein
VLLCANSSVLGVLINFGLLASLPKTQIVDNREAGLEAAEFLLNK